MEISGETDPKIEPYTDLVVHATFQLKKDSSVRFFHYSTCQIVVVVGGTVEIGPTAFNVTSGGQVKSVIPRRCSQSIQLSAPSPGIAAGGLILRGAKSAIPTFSIRPSFVLGGPMAYRVKKLQILNDGHSAPPQNSVAELLAGHGHAAWNSTTTPLIPGKMYTLQLLDANNLTVGIIIFGARDTEDGFMPEILSIN